MTQGSTVVNFADLAGVRAMLADRQPVPMVRRKQSPDPSLPRDGVDAGQWEPDALGLPKGCPVTPLGIVGSTGFFLDPIGQVQQLAPPYGKGHLLGLFGGDANFLAWAWPRWGKKGIDGFAAEAAAAALIMACNAKGPWDSVERIRGRGAWLGRDGALVYHRGTKVRAGKADHVPGEIDGHIYPTRPRLDGPWPGEIVTRLNPARMLRQLLGTWQWARPIPCTLISLAALYADGGIMARTQAERDEGDL